jgi:uncharacterized protein YgiM (DUF1202 family)
LKNTEEVKYQQLTKYMNGNLCIISQCNLLIFKYKIDEKN